MQGNLGAQTQMCRLIYIVNANGKPEKEKANTP